jgi:hypothetical protein
LPVWLAVTDCGTFSVCILTRGLIAGFALKEQHWS